MHKILPMKNGLLISNVILFILVGVLFYFQFSNKSKTSNVVSSASTSQGSAAGFRIAYFEMDSVENSYNMVKDVKAELSKREDDITTELMQMDRELKAKAAKYQTQNLNQAQSEIAQRDMMDTQQGMRNRRQKIEQDYQDFKMRKQQEINSRIEEYLKEYNKSKNFTYIVSYEQGLFYYKDTAYNITGDLISGLNSSYKKDKKK